MKITEISQQKNNKERFNLYVDDSFLCGISSSTIAKENLYKGMEIDERRMENILKSDLENRVFDRVAENLSKSPKTELQVKRYMSELLFKKSGKWFSKDINIEEKELKENVLNRLKEYNFLNDEAYARMFVESRIRNKPRGKMILINELRVKGISKEMAQRVCDELVDDEFSLLRRIYTKKYGDEPISYHDTKKIQFLQRKGFSWDLIQKILTDDSGE